MPMFFSGSGGVKIFFVMVILLRGLDAQERPTIVREDLFEIANIIFSRYPEYASGLLAPDEEVVFKTKSNFVYPPACFRLEAMVRVWAECIATFQRLLPQDVYESLSRHEYGYIQKIVVNKPSTLVVVGDIRGSVHSLLRNLICLHDMGVLQKDFVVSKNHYLFFTGNYVDYGRWGFEVLFLLMILKCINPNNVFLLKGAHEACDSDNVWHAQKYHFLQELRAKYPEKATTFFKAFVRMFTRLPLAIYVGDGVDFVQICHAGVPLVCDVFGMCFLQEDLCLERFLHNGEKCEYRLIRNNDNFYCGELCCGSVLAYQLYGAFGPFLLGVEQVCEYCEPVGVRNILRGHYRAVAAVNILQELYRDDGVSSVWRGLECGGHSVPLKENVAYTMMSCPEGGGGDEEGSCNVDGFAWIVLRDGYNKWTIAQRQLKLPASIIRNAKYVSSQWDEHENRQYYWKNIPEEIPVASRH